MDLECYAFIEISVLTKCGQDKYQFILSTNLPIAMP